MHLLFIFISCKSQKSEKKFEKDLNDMRVHILREYQVKSKNKYLNILCEVMSKQYFAI